MFSSKKVNLLAADQLSNDSSDGRKALQELLIRNHEYAVLRKPNMEFHNHIPHALGSSYRMGADRAKLTSIFATEVPILYSVDDGFRRGVINETNWRQQWGDKNYTVAYMDFFDSQIARENGDWKKVTLEYLYSGDEPLINGFFSGLGHPLIHLAFAYEFDIAEVASEALSLGCTEYGPIHELFDNEFPSPASSTGEKATVNLSDVLLRAKHDPRFENIAEHPGAANYALLFSRSMGPLAELWSTLEVRDIYDQLRNWLHVAVLLCTTSGQPGEGFDFFLAHTLTAAWAVRILLPHLGDASRQATMVRHLGMHILLTYLAQLRPPYDPQAYPSPKEAASADWSWGVIFEKAIESPWYTDVHWPKVIRALKGIEDLQETKSDFYRHAATKFLTEFSGWTGFGLGADKVEKH